MVLGLVGFSIYEKLRVLRINNVLLQVPAEGQASSGRRKTSKYFNTDKSKAKDEVETQVLAAKRKTKEDDGDDSVLPTNQKKVAGSTPTKKLKSGSGRGIPQKPVDLDESDEEDEKDAVTPIKSGGRGRGGRGASTPASGGRGRGGGRGTAQKTAVMEENDEDEEKDVASAKSGGRGRGGRGASAQPSGGRGRGGGGRGGFMNFGERKDPPHKGEKVQIYQISGSFNQKNFFHDYLKLHSCSRKSPKVLLTV